MRYTVHQLAKAAQVSVRTLHYYDQIGLLKPATLEENGYRIYEDRQVLKLDQILFFRELEFSLEQILEILNSPQFDLKAALRDQKKFLELKKLKIEETIKEIDKTIKGGEQVMSKITNPVSDQLEQYKKEAQQRWGQTDAYKQSVERTKNYSKADFARVQAQFQEITQSLADLMDQGIADPAVQKLILRHHQHIGQFYDCSLEMYRALGQMYVDDPRFTKTYDDFKPGLAHFVREAIAYYCDQAK